ncbi:hypothetical protein L3Q82_001027 [Scortum barcoo]|uniref:Uncharacterized protein n=1 Tax=Scortum barcoo TaxID=214431 RepID=A0ACB8WB09_9TELE|nr:hypothetical protein L3Q82_001027 [Scortum barcoo]
MWRKKEPSASGSRPGNSLIHGKNLSSHDKITWTPEADQAFIDLKLALQSSPTLGLPDPTNSFTQAVDERDGCMTSVLLQTHGDKLRPVTTWSSSSSPLGTGSRAGRTHGGL